MIIGKSNNKDDESLEKYSSSKTSYAPKDQVIKNSDVLIVLGGDGTLLHIADAAAKNKKPVLGINLGNLGFLNDIAPEDISTSLIQVINGNYSKETRMFLSASLNDSKYPYFIAREL